MKNIQKLIPVIIILLLAIVSWFILPDTVAVQVGSDGQITSTLPKLAALAIPVVLGLFSTGMLMSGENNRLKGVVLSVLSVLVMAAFLVFNLVRL